MNFLEKRINEAARQADVKWGRVTVWMSAHPRATFGVGAAVGAVVAAVLLLA